MEDQKLLNSQQIEIAQHLEKPNEVNQELRPNFTKTELQSANLPAKVAKEIRLEKYRILFINLAGIILLVISAFFLLAWFIPTPEFNETNQIYTKWLIPVSYIPHPGFMFVLFGVGLIIFILSWIEYAHVITSVNRYKGDILMKKDSVPYFLIKSYRSLVARSIYLNWISISTYVLTGITIGILFAISAIKTTLPLTTEKNISYIILGLTFALHLISLILIKHRKGNLNSYYGRDLVNLEEQKQIAKTANRRCLIIFFIVLAILLVFVMVPWMLIRKKKGQNPIPFI